MSHRLPTAQSSKKGKYWEMHERLFLNQRNLKPEELVGHAQELGLNEGDFKQCLDGNTYAAAVRKDMAEAQKAGITGTPAFFLAVPDGPEGKVKTVRRLSGAQPFAAFQAAIDELLAEKK